jgi:hypothetical protein
MAILYAGAGHLYTVVGELASFDGNSDSVVPCEEPPALHLISVGAVQRRLRRRRCRLRTSK